MTTSLVILPTAKDSNGFSTVTFPWPNAVDSHGRMS
jgi:hypothetical protein